jgi:hypothetical protein
MGALLHLN